MRGWIGYCAFLIVGIACASHISESASAHDLWLVPLETSPSSNTRTISARSGMDFPVSVHAPRVDRFTRLLAFDPSGAPLEGHPIAEEGLNGQYQIDCPSPGIYVSAVVTEAKQLELDAAEFNAYLVSDGLPHIYNFRSKQKTLHESAKEQYTKSPKVLFRVGTSNEGDFARVVGLPLEIVPLDNPFQSHVGATLRVRVLFEGKPLPDAHLGWDHPADGDEASGTVRTDAKGEALIPIAKQGLMTIRLTHMTHPQKETYEWESFWTTLTFEVSEAK